MARTNIDVIVTVRDGASTKLDGISKKIKDTGQAAKGATVDLTQLNRTIFGTTAAIATTLAPLYAIKKAIDFGEELDKTSTAFERQMGPKSDFIKSLQKSTNIVLDEVSALQIGFKLSSFGITKTTKSTAMLVAQLGVLASMSGKDASKGAIDLGEALVDGNVAMWEQYGIIRKKCRKIPKILHGIGMDLAGI